MNPLLIPFALFFLAFAGYILWLLWAMIASPIPLPYNFKSIFVRWRSTAATIVGVALVVAVFILLNAMAAGLEKSSDYLGKVLGYYT